MADFKTKLYSVPDDDGATKCATNSQMSSSTFSINSSLTPAWISHSFIALSPHLHKAAMAMLTKF